METKEKKGTQSEIKLRVKRSSVPLTHDEHQNTFNQHTNLPR